VCSARAERLLVDSRLPVWDARAGTRGCLAIV
jgi:hypothetical protein